MTIDPRILETLEEVRSDGVILCIRLGADAPVSVVDACLAAARGGLRVLEITLTTPGALDAIRELSKEDVIVGAVASADPMGGGGFGPFKNKAGATA